MHTHISVFKMLILWVCWVSQPMTTVCCEQLHQDGKDRWQHNYADRPGTWDLQMQSTYTYKHACMHACAHTHTHMHAHMHACRQASMRARAHTHTHRGYHSLGSILCWGASFQFAHHTDHLSSRLKVFGNLLQQGGGGAMFEQAQCSFLQAMQQASLYCACVTYKQCFHLTFVSRDNNQAWPWHYQTFLALHTPKMMIVSKQVFAFGFCFSMWDKLQSMASLSFLTRLSS